MPEHCTAWVWSGPQKTGVRSDDPIFGRTFEKVVRPVEASSLTDLCGSTHFRPRPEVGFYIARPCGMAFWMAPSWGYKLAALRPFLFDPFNQYARSEK